MHAHSEIGAPVPGTGLCIMSCLMYIDACTYTHVHVLDIITFFRTQQEHVLAELEEYACGTPAPCDSESVLQTVAFLKACNALFERGILGKRVFIKHMESPIIASMDRGYQFFVQWLNEKLDEGTYSVSY